MNATDASAYRTTCAALSDPDDMYTVHSYIQGAAASNQTTASFQIVAYKLSASTIASTLKNEGYTNVSVTDTTDTLNDKPVLDISVTF